MLRIKRRSALLLATCIALILPLETYADADVTTRVVFVSSQGFIIENKATIEAPNDIVWRALVNHVDQWWPKDHSWWGEQGTFSIEPRAGGCFCEVAGKRSAEHMRIAFVAPEALLRMSGGLGPLQGMGMHGALDWQFEQTGENTHLTLTYSVSGIRAEGFDDLAPIVANVQGQQLVGLKRFVQAHHH